MKRGFVRGLEVLMTAALASAAVLVVSSPAQAYTCSRGISKTVYHDHGVAKVNINFRASCTDGRVHWDGVVYDTLCDGRAARTFLMSPWTPIPGSPAFESPVYTTSNGCGTSSSFKGSSNSPGADAADIWLSACNAWCADYDMEDLL
jgi:hypothetical protein